jgi:hypothetical protein
MTQLYLCLSVPEEHMAPTDTELRPRAILRGEIAAPAQLGRNTLVFPPRSFSATELHYEDAQEHWQSRQTPPVPFDFTFVSAAQRQWRDSAYRQLAALMGDSSRPVEVLYPFIALVPRADETLIYHQLLISRHGALFVAYDRVPSSGAALSTSDICAMLLASRDKWEVARRSYNQGCWYAKWRREVEMEQKYTFAQPVDTWALTQKLYRRILDGQLPGFIPEFNDEFQVWDFENYMVEVLEPAAEAGYISFIPQSNGLMTVKRKRFQEDAEIRQEILAGDVDISLAQLEDYAREISQGTIRRLPAFRRKRFDINLESVETGNVYGIFMDICRPLGDDSQALYQCEVEYLRSRTMAPLDHVREEYEQVCAFTKAFLNEQNCCFTEGYYSKLSFLRDYVAGLTRAKEK